MYLTTDLGYKINDWLPTLQFISVKGHKFVNFEVMYCENDRRESIVSQISVASAFSEDDRRRNSVRSTQRRASIFVPNTNVKESEEKMRRRSIISITRKMESSKDEIMTNEQGKGTMKEEIKNHDEETKKPKTKWMEDLVDMFIVPKAELHINDDRGILTKDNSIERLINLILTAAFILAGLATAILTQFEFTFGPTKAISLKGGMHFLSCLKSY